MKSKYIIVDIIGVLALLPLLLINIVPVLAQNYYSEVIHPTGSTCLVYSIDNKDFYINASAIYSIYDAEGNLVEQEYPMWVALSNGSVITIIYREYIADIYLGTALRFTRTCIIQPMENI